MDFKKDEMVQANVNSQINDETIDDYEVNKKLIEVFGKNDDDEKELY